MGHKSNDREKLVMDLTTQTKLKVVLCPLMKEINRPMRVVLVRQDVGVGYC